MVTGRQLRLSCLQITRGGRCYCFPDVAEPFLQIVAAGGGEEKK